MDYNEYALDALIRTRHAELIAQARAETQAQRYGSRHGALRATAGTAFIRLGAWLLRDGDGPMVGSSGRASIPPGAA